MEISTLNAVSPVDGRYRKAAQPLADFFSEGALIRYRVRIEVEYFIALCELPLPQLDAVSADVFPALREIYETFSLEDAQKVKDIERVTNHDVKAVEYFLKDEFDRLGIGAYKEFIHFGLTSQDVNNTAVPLSLKEAWEQTVRPMLEKVLKNIEEKAEEWKAVPMLARTHGQPASPTRLGKEFYVFAERLIRQMKLIKTIPFSAKFGGATGNLNAHHCAYPAIDWVAFSNRFVNETLGLDRCQFTTQIEHYDNMGAFFDNIKRINTILLDLSKDMWAYISMEYFKQKIKENEVGSSTMPHKVNPIDFENAEGNLGIANAVFEHLSAKLPISRLQRDLTDSTVTRNIGVPLAHTLIGYNSLMRGLNKILLNEDALKADLENNWAVVAEGIQTVLRREGIPNPYEALKALTRKNKHIDRKIMTDFISSLDISQDLQKELLNITPENYTGAADF